MRRDTFVLRPEGHIVLRFQANNPGVWLFHCHIEWHVDQGLVATMIEAPLELQKSLNIPQSHFDTCANGKMPYAGNAAGNTKDFLDLTGANVPHAPMADGFTTKGIVAMTFSVLAALLGLAVITWYVLSRSSAFTRFANMIQVWNGRYGRCNKGDRKKMICKVHVRLSWLERKKTEKQIAEVYINVSPN